MAGRPLLSLSYDPKVEAAAAAMAIPCINLVDPQELATLPTAWQQAQRWRLSAELLARHRQRNGCHRGVLGRLER